MNTFNPFLETSVSLNTSYFVMGTLFLVILALIALFVIILQLGTRIRYLTYPVYDRITKEAEKKAHQMLEEASEQSRAIRTKAEMEAGKLLVDRKAEDEALKEKFSKELSDVASHGKEILSKQISEAGLLLGEITGAFKGHAGEADVALKEEVDAIKHMVGEERERLQKEFAGLYTKVEGDHKAFLEENKKQITQALELEIKTVKDAVESYRAERFKMIDREVVELIETVARLSLNRSLSLKEHTDIILTALKEAKQQGVFGK